MEAEGSALAENEKYLDSIQGRIDLFNNSVQTMWNNALDSSVIKGFVDFGTTLVKIVDTLGLIPSILISIGAVKSIGKLFKSFDLTKSQSILSYVNSLTVGFQKNAAAQTLANAATLKQDAVNKLLNSSIIRRLATEQLDGQLKEANLAREVRIVTAKTALALAEEQYAEGLIDDIALQTAKNAVDTASVPINLSQLSVTTLLGAAFKGLAVSIWGAVKAIAAFLFTNPVGWFILAIGAIAGGIAIFNHFHKTAEELGEELSDLKSELSDIRSEIDSLNTELETTQSRMAELLAMDSLSFAEEEELSNLQKQNDELERQIYLLEQKQKRKQKEAEDTFDEIMHSVKQDKTVSVMGAGSITEAQELNTHMYLYEQYATEEKAASDALIKAEQSGNEKEIKKAEKKYEKAKKKTQKEREYIDNKIEEWVDAADGIDYDLADDETKEYLDYIYNLQDKFNIMDGDDKAKSIAITRIFNKEEFAEVSDEINALVEKLEKDPTNNGIINQIQSIIEGNAELKESFEAVGLSVAEVTDYFTLQSSGFNSNTVEGIASQYQEGIEVLESFKTQQEEMIALGNQYNNLVNGNVDYNKRPFVSPEKMKAVYPEFDGDIATTWDQDETYGDGKGGIRYTLKFTPILEDGTILDEESYNEYINKIFAELDNANGDINKALEYDAANYKILINWQEGAVEYDDNNMSELDRQLDTIKQKHTELKNTIEANFDDIFEIDSDGNYKVVADEFSKMLKGMDIEAQEAFARVVESAANGAEDLSKVDWDQAIASFNISGITKITKVMEQQWGEINKSIFKGIDDGAISGWIDTFSELGAALENVASSMDLLHTAQTQMTNSGRISIKTALEIIESTDRWNEVLTITGDTIQLTSNAEDVLVQSKLNVIKAQIEEALGAVELQLAQLGAADSAYAVALASDVSDEAYEQYTNAMNSYSASIAAFGAALDAIMSGNWGGALSAFQDTYKTAKQIANSSADKNRVNRADLEKQRRDLQAQRDMINQGGTVSSFKNNYDFDKTPGDKYDDDGDSALEKLQKKYEHKLSNLDNQKTWIENEIEALEAKEEGISGSYYEALIKNEEERIDVLEEQRNKLNALLETTPKGTDEWYEVADAIWENSHALQEAAINAANYRKEIVNLYTDAFEEIGAAYDDKGQLYEDRKAYIEGYKELAELKGKLPSASMYNSLIAEEENLKANNIAKLASQEALYYQMLADGRIELNSEAAKDMEADMRATEKAIQDNDIALAQFNADLKELYLTGWDTVMNAFSNRGTFFENQISAIDTYISRLESLNIDVPDEVYDKQIEITQQDLNVRIQPQLDFAREELVTIESEFGNDSQEYFDKYSEVVDLEKQKEEAINKVIETEQQIIQNRFEEFNQLVDRINDNIQELSNVADLISDEDVALEDGSWTKEGLTQLGLLYQQMELNTKTAEEYNIEMEKLNALYDAGEISEQTYYERLQELKDGQWDAVKAYKDAEDAIIDVNEARIDMIEQGLDKEIEAYSELIDLKKEELDAERDLYDFRKDIQKQTKDIASLERRIASMSGSSDVSTIAERTKLEAELREAREGLDDTYYNHAMDSQSNALDNELESYEKSAKDYIKSLRESIKETELVIETTFQNVMLNADIVLSEINRLSSEYKVPIDSNLVSPWETAASKATSFKNTVITDVGFLTSEQGVITLFGTNAKQTLESVFGSGATAAGKFYTKVDEVIDGENGIKQKLANSKGNMTENLGEPWNTTAGEGGPIYTFSQYVNKVLQGAIDSAKGKYEDMKNALQNPWLTAQNTIHTFFADVEWLLNDLVTKSKAKGAEIAKNLDVKPPSDDTGYTPSNNNDTTTDKSKKPGGEKTITDPAYIWSANVERLQRILKYVFGYNLGTYGIDGKYGKSGGETWEAVKKMQKEIRNYLGSKGFRDLPSVTGKYDAKTRQALETYLNNNASARHLASTKANTNPKFLPTAIFAKGTLGTTKDEFAITDESWIGEEITLAAGKNGQLQYLKKGSAVMPADISANLVEWGKLNPNMMGISNMTEGINLMSSYINKPEIKLDIENFLKVDRVDRDTLPELERLMDKKIDTFAKQLNASIRKFK
jgi:hypothetical protein